MNIINRIWFTVLLITLTSCEIVQETRFNANGSGTYSLGFDLSEMTQLGDNSSTNDNKQVDTLIVFSDVLKTKKDSIAQLTKEEQRKIKDLENFSLRIKTDSVENKFEMKINYAFKDVSELKMFSEKLKDQDIKELKFLTEKTKEINSKKDGSLPDFNKSYNTVFNKKMFSNKISKKGLKEARKKQDTTLTKNNLMSDMIRFKSKYYFPFKIKSTSNKNARILPDFKGIEITGNLYEINNNPHFFDIEVEFDKN